MLSDPCCPCCCRCSTVVEAGVAALYLPRLRVFLRLCAGEQLLKRISMSQKFHCYRFLFKCLQWTQFPRVLPQISQGSLERSRVKNLSFLLPFFFFPSLVVSWSTGLLLITDQVALDWPISYGADSKSLAVSGHQWKLQTVHKTERLQGSQSDNEFILKIILWVKLLVVVPWLQNFTRKCKVATESLYISEDSIAAPSSSVWKLFTGPPFEWHCW